MFQPDVQFVNWDPQRGPMPEKLDAQFKDLSRDLELVYAWLEVKSADMVQAEINDHRISADMSPDAVTAKQLFRTRAISKLLGGVPWFSQTSDHRVQREMPVRKDEIPRVIGEAVMDPKVPRLFLDKLSPVVGNILRALDGPSNGQTSQEISQNFSALITVFTLDDRRGGFDAAIASPLLEMKLRKLDGDAIGMSFTFEAPTFTINHDAFVKEGRADLQKFLASKGNQLIGDPVDVPV